MRILYVHHADRDRSNKNIERQDQDITTDGIKETEILAEKLKRIKVTAIYSSPYIRCMHTAEIINKYQNVDIIKEERFNEMKKDESWKELQMRNMEAIDDIINKYREDDFIICITSGVNLSAFIYYFTNIKPSDDNPWIQAVTTSPVLFSTDNKVF